jgi:hypothetical protein
LIFDIVDESNNCNLVKTAMNAQVAFSGIAESSGVIVAADSMVGVGNGSVGNGVGWCAECRRDRRGRDRHMPLVESIDTFCFDVVVFFSQNAVRRCGMRQGIFLQNTGYLV